MTKAFTTFIIISTVESVGENGLDEDTATALIGKGAKFRKAKTLKDGNFGESLRLCKGFFVITHTTPNPQITLPP